MVMRSTPHSAPIRTVSANTPTASSKSKSPYGFKSLPVGPMSSDMNFSCLPQEVSLARFAFATAALIISLSLSGSNLSVFAPKVFVFTILLPASK